MSKHIGLVIFIACGFGLLLAAASDDPGMRFLAFIIFFGLIFIGSSSSVGRGVLGLFRLFK